MASTSSNYKFFSHKNNTESGPMDNEPSTSNNYVTGFSLPSRTSDFFSKSTKAKRRSSQIKSINCNKQQLQRDNLNTTVTSRHINAAKKKAMNTSLMKQSLRANNKALARALEMAKNEIKILKEENLTLKATVQEMQTELNRQQDMDAFENLFEKAVEESVKTKLAEVFGDVDVFVDGLKRKMAEQNDYVNDFKKLCKKYTDPSSLADNSADSDVSVDKENRKSSLESSSDEFGRRYSAQQKTIFGRRLSVKNDKDKDQPQRTDKNNQQPIVVPAVAAAPPALPSFSKKAFDLSTVIEQSTLDQSVFEKDVSIIPEEENNALETIPEIAPESRRSSRRSTLFGQLVFNRGISYRTVNDSSSPESPEFEKARVPKGEEEKNNSPKIVPEITPARRKLSPRRSSLFGQQVLSRRISLRNVAKISYKEAPLGKKLRRGDIVGFT